MDVLKTDFLVIGGGIAGLSFALKAAEMGQVNLILKDGFEQCSTQYAQGGINAVMDPSDSYKAHCGDTERCGYGLCEHEVVQNVVARGPEVIQELIDYGVDFTRTQQGLSLHREGGHSFNRVVHSKDATGAAIMSALIARVREEPRIQVLENHMAVDLILDNQTGGKSINPNTRCVGAYVLRTETSKVCALVASVTYLATGGIGKVYPFTSNPATASGDGIAMAYRAGIEVCNMEFIQFHPTLLFHHQLNSFLITEAVRGEGGILRNLDGHAFMAEYSDQKDLAPRDVVARAIDSEIKKSGGTHVWLDVTHLGRDHVVHHFPNIYEKLMGLGIDIAKEYIPVVPAAHYLCGGLRVDGHGRTHCKGLFAGGECCYTGLHGANRLASNSLLEAAVYATASIEYLRDHLQVEMVAPTIEIAPWVYHDYSDDYEESLVGPLWHEVRNFMGNYVGIIRTDKRLARAMSRIRFLREEIESSYWDFRISKDLIELRNISIIAELIIRSACERKETRGLHFNVDHAETRPEFAQATGISLQKHGLFR